jgi:3-carboxy-cis,cis-muconate cycloisomerase
MAHKHNPVAAVSALACAKRVPGLVTTVLAAMEQEHERAAGAWQAEWGTVTELMTLTGSATAWTRELLENLQVHPDLMAANLAGAPTGDQPPPDGVAELIDRALEAHRA